MTQNKHTKGPWVIEPRRDLDAIDIMPLDCWRACFIRVYNLARYRTNTTTLEANARLIAAAPDMLTALEYMREAMLLQQRDGHGLKHVVQYNIELIDKAIKKAKGE